MREKPEMYLSPLVANPTENLLLKECLFCPETFLSTIIAIVIKRRKSMKISRFTRLKIERLADGLYCSVNALNKLQNGQRDAYCLRSAASEVLELPGRLQSYLAFHGFSSVLCVNIDLGPGVDLGGKLRDHSARLGVSIDNIANGEQAA